MKIRIAMIAVVIFVAVGLCFYFRQNPAEKVAHEVLEGNYPSKKKADLTPELRAFVDWYDPMVKDASKEVFDVMRRFDPKYRSRSGHRDRELEELVPADEWIQRHLDMGVKIESYDDYSDYLADRYAIYRAIKNPESLPEKKEWHGLPPTATFDEFIKAEIRENVRNKQILDQAMANDPKVYGGEFGADGDFIPYRFKTVYVQPGTITSGDGVPKWVVYELENRDIGLSPSREIPKDIDVIYLDEKGQPRKDRVPPSFRESDEIEGFPSGETDSVFDSASVDSPLADDFDNSFPDDLPPSDTGSYEFEKPKVPPSVTDLKKQFSSEEIEAELREGLSPKRFDKAQQLIDQYGSEEGLRRLRDMDPDAARRFEREQSSPPVREEVDKGKSLTR